MAVPEKLTWMMATMNHLPPATRSPVVRTRTKMSTNRCHTLSPRLCRSGHMCRPFTRPCQRMPAAVVAVVVAVVGTNSWYLQYRQNAFVRQGWSQIFLQTVALQPVIAPPTTAYPLRSPLHRPSHPAAPRTRPYAQARSTRDEASAAMRKICSLKRL